MHPLRAQNLVQGRSWKTRHCSDGRERRLAPGQLRTVLSHHSAVSHGDQFCSQPVPPILVTQALKGKRSRWNQRLRQVPAASQTDIAHRTLNLPAAAMQHEVALADRKSTRLNSSHV